jgi:N-acetylmuramoyl-L-alanine amidase
MKIYLDPGHGGSDPGASGNGLQEKDIVLDLAKRMERLLRDYPQADVRLSRNGDISKSLRARTEEANRWKADIFVSLHCNAFNGNVRGYEDFVYSGLSAGAKARAYQTILHRHIQAAAGLPDRGRKQANFHVLRESAMPAVLTENGFIDHAADAQLMKQTAWRERVAAAHVRGLAEIFQLKKQKGEFQVVAGSFQTRENALARKRVLEARGLAASVQQASIGAKRMYRVIAGNYSTREKAGEMLKQLARQGVEAFIVKAS